MLGFVLSPERAGELVDPVTTGTEAFRRRIDEIGHAATVGLFDFESPKSADVEDDSVVIMQTPSAGRRWAGKHVRLQLRSLASS